MIFSRYGLDLQRLEPGHLEMVRQWRNAPWVRDHMQFRENITPESQEAWFSRLRLRRDWYFVAHLNTSPFALVQVKNVDWKEKKGEAGAFVGDTGYIGHPQAALAILSLMDFSFFILGLQRLEAKYRLDLREIAMLNRQLGYQVIASEGDGFVRAAVDVSRYLQVTGKSRSMGERLYGSSTMLRGEDRWIRKKAAKGRGSGLPQLL
jgi:hypothetical protein